MVLRQPPHRRRRAASRCSTGMRRRKSSLRGALNSTPAWCARLARRGLHRPRGVAQGEIDVGRVRRFVARPRRRRAARRRARREAGQRLAEFRFEFARAAPGRRSPPPPRPCTGSTPCAGRPGVCRRTAAPVRAAPPAAPRARRSMPNSCARKSSRCGASAIRSSDSSLRPSASGSARAARERARRARRRRREAGRKRRRRRGPSPRSRTDRQTPVRIRASASRQPLIPRVGTGSLRAQAPRRTFASKAWGLRHPAQSPGLPHRDPCAAEERGELPGPPREERLFYLPLTRHGIPAPA